MEVSRIMIIGCGGAGKSTLGRELHQKTGLPLIYLDQVFWDEYWVEPDREKWANDVRKLIQDEQWIMDGNYGSTMEMRLERAEMIIFLDMPTWLCLFRIFRRQIQYWGKVRPSMPANCPERLTWTFVHYVLNYRKTRKPGIMKTLNELKQDKQVCVLQKPAEVRTFLAQFKG